jgi:uncharacterized membrane protein
MKGFGASCLAAVTLLAGAAHAASFTGLGGLPSGFFATSAQDVSADGSVVVGHGTGAAFRWTQTGGLVSLGTLPGSSSSFGFAVSGNGAVVAGSSLVPGGEFEAWRWTAGGGMQSLGVPPGATRTDVFGLSGNGSVAAGDFSLGGTFQPFRWTQATGIVDLGSFNAPGTSGSTFASDVSADGTVIVGHGTAGAFRWTQATGKVGLGASSRAFGVSADGLVVVGDGSGGAYRWTAATGIVPLGAPPGWSASTAQAASGDGSVIVGDAVVASNLVAFIWDAAHGTRSLQDVLIGEGLASELAGWRLFTAQGVSDDGLTIVGAGINPRGASEAFIARLGPAGTVPEPGSLLLLGSALAALAALRRRRR